LNAQRDLPAFRHDDDILEFGVPVEVQPPPDSKVIDEAEFDRLMAS
jgi:hypothetical protein